MLLEVKLPVLTANLSDVAEWLILLLPEDSLLFQSIGTVTMGTNFRQMPSPPHHAGNE